MPFHKMFLFERILCFVEIIIILKNPQFSITGNPTQPDDGSSRVPVTPWCQALAMFLNISLLGSLLHTAYREFLAFLACSLILYLAYGIRHGGKTSKIRRKPSPDAAASSQQQQNSSIYLSPSSSLPNNRGPSTSRTFSGSTELYGQAVPRSRSEEHGLSQLPSSSSFFNNSSKDYARMEQIGLESVQS